MRPDKILRKLRRAVEEMESSKAERAAKEAVAAGTDPVIAITDGLARGMKTVSDLFDEGEAFIPQLLVAADAFETGADIITESMDPEGRYQLSQGRVLICTVQGDIHDIGKNIVKTMLVSNGFEVIDLGRDVSTEDVIREAKKHQVDIIIGAALMRTTMSSQRDIVQALEEEGIRCRFKCLFGGSPVSADWVKSIGGDAYAETAAQAVEQAKRLMAEIRAMAALHRPAA
ncbi:MAG: corrinoid protein [Desulfobulbus sp.]